MNRGRCLLLFSPLAVDENATPGFYSLMKHLVTFRVIDAIARTGSIRAAAEHLSLTASAVQRRLQAYELELGYQIFERWHQGMKLNPAGELVILHIRETLVETRKLNTRLADLSGLRRGEVRIGCSQALVPYFLAHHIKLYKAQFPKVIFEVHVLKHGAAEKALAAFAIDIALVFSASDTPDFKILLGVQQRLAAIMSIDHPLTRYDTVRLRQCYEYPIALASGGLGSRAMINAASRSLTCARPPELESNSFDYLKTHIAGTNTVSFQVEIGAPRLGGTDHSVAARLVDTRDVRPGALWLGHLAGRGLSVAVSQFVEQISEDLAMNYDSL